MNFTPKVLAENVFYYVDDLNLHNNMANGQGCIALGTINYIKNDKYSDNSNAVSVYQIGVLSIDSYKYADNIYYQKQFVVENLGVNKLDGELNNYIDKVGLLSEVNHKYDLNISDEIRGNYIPQISEIVGLEINTKNNYIKTIYTFDGIGYRDIPNLNTFAKNHNLEVCDYIPFFDHSSIISRNNNTFVYNSLLSSNNSTNNHSLSLKQDSNLDIYYISGIIALILIIGILIFKLTKKDKPI